MQQLSLLSLPLVTDAKTAGTTRDLVKALKQWSGEWVENDGMLAVYCAGHIYWYGFRHEARGGSPNVGAGFYEDPDGDAYCFEVVAEEFNDAGDPYEGYSDYRGLALEAGLEEAEQCLMDAGANMSNLSAHGPISLEHARNRKRAWEER